MLILFLVGALVWGIAHFTAQPGEEVSILWGMVEYTKDELHIEPEATPEPKSESEQGSEAKAVLGIALSEKKTSLSDNIISSLSGSQVVRKFENDENSNQVANSKIEKAGLVMIKEGKIWVSTEIEPSGEGDLYLAYDQNAWGQRPLEKKYAFNKEGAWWVISIPSDLEIGNRFNSGKPNKRGVIEDLWTQAGPNMPVGPGVENYRNPDESNCYKRR